MNEQERMESRTASLEAFLYVLLRDHLTLGECERLMMGAAEAHRKGATFSNQHLRDYVDELVARIAK